jgi:hypothetical protein
LARHCGTSLQIPDTWEAEVGGFKSECSQGKSVRPYLKNKLKAKRTGDRGKLSGKPLKEKLFSVLYPKQLYLKI